MCSPLTAGPHWRSAQRSTRSWFKSSGLTRAYTLDERRNDKLAQLIDLAMTYAFIFDANACSGCKTCQEACKDKNGLPAGMLWRRVIEVTGGEWRKTGEAWENSVFAYYLSLACNHCTHPKCAGVCPTDAFSVRTDGIVLLDGSRCMGCGYCAWACPYNAPQYDATQGIMTKCDFCADNLDAGLPPTCVAACPLRVLNCASTEEFKPFQGKYNLWQIQANEHPFPLPQYSRTEPNLAIKLHPAMSSPLEKTVANLEEIHPPQPSENNHGIAAFREIPLVVFTLLAQMAVGVSFCGLMLSSLPFVVTLSIGILLGLGGLTSFLHLGRKRNAWRAVIHLEKSWLSREILMAGLFGIAWAITAARERLGNPLSFWPVAILGLGLIFCMSQVYQLRAVRAWNTWRTPAAFFLSTIVLGTLGVRLAIPLAGLAILAGLAMVGETILMLTAGKIHSIMGKLRAALLGVGILGALLLISLPQVTGGWLPVTVFIIALASEAIGRWQFYTLRIPFPMLKN